MAVLVTRHAQQDYMRLSISDKRAVKRAVEALGNDPMPPKVERIQRDKRFLRIRVGNYRIVYTFDGNLVTVTRVMDRREDYRKLSSKTAMPSWRAQGTDFWNDFDAVIATDANGRGRNFEVWTFGQNWASRHSLAEAKRSVEEVYGPRIWRRVQLPIMPYDHYYFGEIGEEMTDPHSILVADLPRL